jgi:uncharacterized protein (UPF0332 family)
MDDSFDFDYLIKFSLNLLENKDIISDNKYQCVYRTIINRVYYSAFNHAKIWLEINYALKTREFNFETGKKQNIGGLSEHVQVYKELRIIAKKQKNLKNEFRNASSKLEHLFHNRINADYDESYKFSEIEVTDAIENANYIINLLSFN